MAKTSHGSRAPAKPPTSEAADEPIPFRPADAAPTAPGIDHVGILLELVSDAITGETDAAHMLPSFVRDLEHELEVLNLALSGAHGACVDRVELASVVVGMRRRCELVLELHRLFAQRGAA